MKTSLYFCVLCTCLVFISCSKDDDASPSSSKTVEFSGKKYTINDALIEDYGPTTDGSNFYVLRVTDGAFEKPTGVYYVNDDAQFELEFELYSFNSDSEDEMAGTYTFTSFSSQPTTNYFYSGGFDTYVNANEDESYYISGGTITIAGSYPDYTVSYDLFMSNPDSNSFEELVGSFSAEFKVVIN